jgi:hypothetical protein
MFKHKEPLFSVRLYRPDDLITKRWRIKFQIGNLEIDIEIGALVTYWRYCKLCNGILENEGCDKPSCPNHESYPRKHTISKGL